jgi:peptide/nickel transport system permease protein
VNYVFRQAIKLVAVVIAVSLLSFSMLFLLSRGKSTEGVNLVALNIAGAGASSDQVAKVEKDYGLDRPIFVQYAKWAGKAIRGDFGNSYSFKIKVIDLIKQRLPTSLWLMFWAQVIALVVAIALGTLAAYRAQGALDRVASTVAFGFLSVPNYIVAVVLQLFLAVRLGWLPAISEYVSPLTSPRDHLRNYLLPAVSLALGQSAVYMRLLRADMVATLQNDYITMARAKGLPTNQILFRHALRPSTFSMITAAGVNVGALIGGAVIIESIFALPGMGSLLIEAIFRRDLVVVQACVVVFALAFVLVNFAVDMLYAVIDPRVRAVRALA